MESDYLNSQVDRIAKNIDDVCIYLKRINIQMVNMMDSLSKINSAIDKMTKNDNKENKE